MIVFLLCLIAAMLIFSNPEAFLALVMLAIGLCVALVVIVSVVALGVGIFT